MAPVSAVARRSIQSRQAPSSEVSVSLRVSEPATAAQRAKANAAAQSLEAVLNDPAFEAELTRKYGAVKASQMIDKLRDGREALSPQRDQETDLHINFFNPNRRPSWRRKIAKSTSGNSLVQLNQAYFENKSAPQMAQTLAYMLAHKLGYGGSVPQAFAAITAKLAEAPSPSTPTVPTPAPAPTTPTVPSPSSSATPSAIIGAFKQGGTGNCVSIAAIKAGMARFGPDGVAKEIKRSGSGYEVLMRDGYKVSFTEAELKAASGYSEIKNLKDPALTLKANVLYTAMAKRAQKEGNDGWRNMTLKQACTTLNNGENYLEGAKWLGLSQHVKQIPTRDMDKYVATVVASAGHAMFASEGTLDHYGSKRSSLNSYGTRVAGNGSRLIGAYAIV